MKNIAHLLLSVIIILGFVAVIWTLADAFGAWDVYKLQQQARAAEARTQELTAEAHATQAKQTLITTWIMGFASIKDSLLITATYISGAFLLLLTIIINGMLLLERRHYHDRDY